MLGQDLNVFQKTDLSFAVVLRSWTKISLAVLPNHNLWLSLSSHMIPITECFGGSSVKQ